MYYFQTMTHYSPNNTLSKSLGLGTSISFAANGWKSWYPLLTWNRRSHDVPYRKRSIFCGSCFSLQSNYSFPGWSPRANNGAVSEICHFPVLIQRIWKTSALIGSVLQRIRSDSARTQRCSALIFSALKNWVFTADS